MRAAIVSAVLLGNPLLWAAEADQPTPPSLATNQPFMFAVFGDNRGDESGEQPPAFLQVLEAINQRNPAFVLDTGDMIYGHTRDEARLREQWKIYRAAASRLRAPLFHIPGNHDIWNEASARMYRELWGTNYYAFDCGNARFIGLDTESVSSRIDQTQFSWLEQQLRDCHQPNVFVFFHRPLFPVDGGIGSSLDVFASERDRLHNLFVKYRDVIRTVFTGHEHLYRYQKRDGISYYTTGGGGAPLYTAPELGGFHHFLLVRVAGKSVDVTLEKVCAPTAPLAPTRLVAPGALLESWQAGLFWYAWDRSATVELTSEEASQGQRGLRLNFDPVQYAWPVLVLSFPSRWNLDDSSALSLDVYVPHGKSHDPSLTPAVQSISKHEAGQVALRPGWNTVTTRLDGRWLPRSERERVESIEWGLSIQTNSGPGYVIFDNFRLNRRAHAGSDSTELLESWERPLLWRVFDETVRAQVIQGSKSDSKQGLLLHLEASKCSRPVLFARLNPPWDLTKVQGLKLQLVTTDNVPKDMAMRLALKSKEDCFESPAHILGTGTNQLGFALEENWLPVEARSRVEQIAFYMSTTNAIGQSDLVFERLSAEPDH
jgi:3',5'-cyclic AMP phosphodiesterase CpdA